MAFVGIGGDNFGFLPSWLDIGLQKLPLSVVFMVIIRLGKDEKTVRRRFRFLKDGGFCSDDERRPKTFTLLYDVDEIEGKFNGILLNSGMRNYLLQKMQEQAQNFPPLIGQAAFVDW